jgi:hypothetical protein
MTIEKQTTVDQITVNALNGEVGYRTVTSIIEDGVVLNRNYARISVPPGTELTDVPANVAAVCNATWTPELIAAYQEMLSAPAPFPQANLQAPANFPA